MATIHKKVHSKGTTEADATEGSGARVDAYVTRELGQDHASKFVKKIEGP